MTVLFADLVGFTARAEQLDPEDVRALLAPYHAHLRAELERFGGTVEKFIGDAVMALFGAPVAHEDDPERAVRAALAIRDWVARAGRRAAGADRRQHRRGARRARRAAERGRGHGRRRRRQHGRAAAGGRAGERDPRRRADVPGDRATRSSTARPSRSRRRARPSRSRSGRRVEARARFGVDVSRRATRRSSAAAASSSCSSRRSRACARSARRSSSRSSASPGSARAGSCASSSSASKHEPELVSLAPGPLAAVRRGRHASGRSAEMVKAQAGILENDDAGRRPRRSSRDASAGSAPTPTERAVARAPPAPARRARPTRSRAAAPRRGVRRLAPLLRGARRGAARSCSSSRTSTGRTTACSTSSTTWSTGRAACRCSSSAPRGRSCSQRRPGWGGGKPNALDDLALAALGRGDRARSCGAARAAAARRARPRGAARARRRQPALRRAVRADAAERGDRRGAALPETVQGIIAARLDALAADEKGCSRTRPSSARSSGSARSRPSAAPSRGEAERAAARARAQGVRPPRARARRSPARASTPSGTCSSATSPTARSRAPRAPRSTGARPSGSSRSGRPEDHAEMLAHHYLAALELGRGAGAEATALGELGPARPPRRGRPGRFAQRAARRPSGFYDAALRLWPENDPERAELLFRRAAPIRQPRRQAIPSDSPRRGDALLAAGDSGQSCRGGDAPAPEDFWSQGRRELADEHAARAATLIAGDAAEPVDGLGPHAGWPPGGLGGRARGRSRARARRRWLRPRGSAGTTASAKRCPRIGMARVEHGDRRGLEDYERSIEIATAAGELGR